MIGNFNWNLVFLKKNPFDLTPPTNPEQIVWAGMKRIKQRFDEIYEVAFSDSATQVVLNQGPYGGGKTHASLYFGNQNNLPLPPTNERQIYHISVCVPKEPGKPAEDLYTDILDTLGMRYVHRIIRDAIGNLPEDETLDLLQKFLGSEELARAFWLYGTEEGSENQALLRSYFLEGTTRTELRKLGIARNITKAQDRFRVLTGVLQCLIGLDSHREVSHPSRVCLWIDEMEDLIYLTSAQFRIVSQGLRDMIDRLPNNFTLFLNMTLADPEEYEDLETILGEALLNRITDFIYFPELELNEAMEYVNELINHPQYRDQSLLKELPQTYPFEAEALKMLLDGLAKKTPRDINKRCRNAINFAFRDNRFPRAGEGIIDPAYVKVIENSELDREIV